MAAIATHITAAPLRRDIDRHRWVSIRPIERADAPGLSDFYARLSPESARRRFLSCGHRSAHDLAEMFTEHEGEGFVGILREAGPDDGAVVAHCSVQPGGEGGAEVAFVVADELQGHGIGQALMEAAVHRARQHGLCRLTASLFAENTPMRHLLLGAGCAILSDTIELGVEEVTLGVR